MVLFHQTIDIAGILHPHNVAPPLRLIKNAQKFGMTFIGCRTGCIFGTRCHEHHARKMRLEGKGVNTAR